MTPEDELHTSRIIACLVRRLGGEVVITAEELRNDPAALSIVEKLDGFEIKVLEHGPPGPDLIDMGYLSLPAEVQHGIETQLAEKLSGRPSPSLLDVGYVERSPTMLGGSLNPSPDCGGPRKPPGAIQLWWCDTHTQFHGPTDAGTTGGEQ